MLLLPASAAHPRPTEEEKKKGISYQRSFLETHPVRLDMQYEWVQTQFPFILSHRSAVDCDLASRMRLMVGAGSNPAAAAAAISTDRREQRLREELCYESYSHFEHSVLRQGHADVRSQRKVGAQRLQGRGSQGYVQPSCRAVQTIQITIPTNAE